MGNVFDDRSFAGRRTLKFQRRRSRNEDLNLLEKDI